MRNNNKNNIKDIVIIALSAIAIVLLILIVVMSGKRDKEISEVLQKDSEITTDTLISSINNSTGVYLEITEAAFDKWLEIHNTGTETIDISGVKVSVNGADSGTVPEGTVILKDEYYCIGLDTNPGGNAENIISLINADGTAIKSMIVPKLLSGTSYGIYDSDTNVWGFMTPSKGMENQGDVTYISYDGISFSAPGGFYDESFELVLECKEGEIIYYTTDGTDPTTESAVYGGPIRISNKSGSGYNVAALAFGYRQGTNYFPSSVDAGMVVRAITVDKSGTVTGEATQSYFIGLTRDTDYYNIAVLSITTDPDNLFDYEEGIYVGGKSKEDALIQGIESGYGNYYNKWKKTANIEYYEPDKGKTLESSGEIMVYPDEYANQRQKSLVINLDEGYEAYEGSGMLKYLSESGYVNIFQNEEDNETKIRNYLINDLFRYSDVGITYSQPVVVFVDGEYFGLYSMQEIYDAKYLNYRYDRDTGNLIIRYDGVYNEEYDSFYNYVTTTDFSVSSNYETLKTRLDVENYAKYICINMYFGNSSFYPYKGTAWRTGSSGDEGYLDGRWRFLLPELNKTMYVTSTESTTINTYLQRGVQSDLMLQSLLMSPEFCETLENTMQELISEYITEDKWKSALDNLADLLGKPARASYTRYYGTLKEATYNSEVALIEEFLTGRAEYIMKYTSELAEKGGDLENARKILKEMEEEKKLKDMINGSISDSSGTDENEDQEDS